MSGADIDTPFKLVFRKKDSFIVSTIIAIKPLDGINDAHLDQLVKKYGFFLFMHQKGDRICYLDLFKGRIKTL
jgi:hypothetical protein